MSKDRVDEKSSAQYIEEPPINAEVEAFFSNYASIPASKLREHLIVVRKQAWQSCNYPCLGFWYFLKHSIQNNPIYGEILEKCKLEGATVIDFACCLGQDVRQLISDGVAPEQIRGYELNPFFIEQGYELFCDGELMKEKKIFHPGDIFDDQFLETIEPADYVHVASFIHLFDAETQRKVCQRLTRIAKRAIIGRQMGASVPVELTIAPYLPFEKMMKHSPESFASMWKEVTNGQWQVESATLNTTIENEYPITRIIFVVRKRKDK